MNRRRVWEILEAAKPGDTASRTFDVLLLGLILLNVLAAILETVPAVAAAAGTFLGWFELVSVAVFTVEYGGRIWACTVDPRFARPVRGRLRFLVQGMSLVDLAAILPFYLPLLGADLRSLRALRLLRILRIAKMGRYSTSLRLIARVLKARKEELVMSVGLMLLLLIVSSSVIYSCESEQQPEVFSSVPATMWWSIATLTTVGYGDMYPVTPLGQFFGSIIAILGIGMFALPAGILGAGFVEEFNRNKAPPRTCPRCGEPLH